MPMRPIRDLTRRAFSAGLLAALAAAPGLAGAQTGYPNRPVQLVVPFAAGGSIDVIFRILSESLGKRLGQPVVVVNRPGGASTIGMGSVAKAMPDGYTFGAASLSFAANGAFLTTPLPYDPARDFVPVTQVFRVPMVMTMNPQVGASNLRELVAHAKANPDKLNYASSGIASSGHLAAALFESVTGTAMVHVPYNTLPLPSVAANDTQVLIGPVSPALAFIRSERLRPMGVTSKERLAVLPEVPTFVEAGVPGYEFYEWAGLVAPAGTPADIVARMQREVAAVLAEPDVRKRITDLGAEIVASSPEQFAAHIQQELARWAQVGQKTRGRPMRQ
jgi:tripartite-type tricarboxylate transporter receptor subunit TctC